MASKIYCELLSSVKNGSCAHDRQNHGLERSNKIRPRDWRYSPLESHHSVIFLPARELKNQKIEFRGATKLELTMENMSIEGKLQEFFREFFYKDFYREGTRMAVENSG